MNSSKKDQAVGPHELLCIHTSELILINIIIDVKNKKLLYSITVTAKSSKKIKGDK